MTKETIRDRYGRIVGTIETDNRGDAVAKDFYGRITGRYQKYDNTTRDFYGRILNSGNTVISTLYTHKYN